MAGAPAVYLIRSEGYLIPSEARDLARGWLELEQARSLAFARDDIGVPCFSGNS